MQIIEEGHIYDLAWLDGSPKSYSEGIIRSLPEGIKETIETFVHPYNRLIFVNREQTPHPGTQTQEVLRALIDRTQHCDNCLRWEGNDKIIHHLRMALALHEARALERKAEKGLYSPELIHVGKDGHFDLTYK